MDPNQTQTPQPVLPQQPTAQSSVNLPTPTAQPPPPSRQSPKLLLALLSLLSLFVAATLILLFANRQSPTSTPDKTVTPPAVSPTPVVSEDELELQSIDVGDIDKDLQDLQGDVDQL